MRIVTADDLARLLTYEALIGTLADAFRAEISVPFFKTGKEMRERLNKNGV